MTASKTVSQDVLNLLESDYYKLWRAFAQLEQRKLEFTSPVNGDGFRYQFAIVKSDASGDCILEKATELGTGDIRPQYRIMNQEQSAKTQEMFYRLPSMAKVAPVFSGLREKAQF